MGQQVQDSNLWPHFWGDGLANRLFKPLTQPAIISCGPQTLTGLIPDLTPLDRSVFSTWGATHVWCRLMESNHISKGQWFTAT